MRFDFDEIIPLKDSHNKKYDMAGHYSKSATDESISMWIADMDFRPPQAVIDALQADVERGIFGYFGPDDSTRSAICNWLRDQHGWAPAPEWLHFTFGVINGLSIVLEAFTKPGDGIIVFTPVYHAFMHKIKCKDRRVVESHLRLEHGRYEMDLDALEAQLTGTEKVLIFCSPHNPGGRLWSAAEINAVADFCLKHDLILVSDEIHMDLTFPGQKHLVTAITAPQAKPKLVTLHGASKGFNIAGGETAFMITEDDDLRAQLTVQHLAHCGTPNRFGMLMIEAAFAHGKDWSDAVRAYLADNFALFRDGVNKIPGIKVMDMPSTYLAWVDFTGTGMSQKEFTDRVEKTAKIVPQYGWQFGTGGENFLRFNLAARRAVIEDAVTRMQKAFADLQ